MDVIDTKPHFDEDFVRIRYRQYCERVNYMLSKHLKPHDRRYRQGFFIPKRPIKCINVVEADEPTPVVYRSSWELEFCKWLDETDSVTRWGSECIKIIYPNPLKKKMSFYVPDMYFEYINKDKKIEKKLIEIKPLAQASLEEAQNGYDRIRIAQNLMKWKAAIEYCKKRDIKFKVMTERDLF